MKQMTIILTLFCLIRLAGAQPDPAYTIDAAIALPDSRMILWGGSQYIKFDMEFKKAANGYPKKIASVLDNFPFETVDAAVVYDNGKTYFFRGSEYFEYDLLGNKPISPRALPINDTTWKGVSFRSIDAAFKYKDNIYLFSADQFTIYNLKKKQADTGFPQKIDKKSWPGLSFQQIDAAFNYQDRVIYFFSGNQYAAFDAQAFKIRSGYPKSIKDNWTGVRFARELNPALQPLPEKPVEPVLSETGIRFFQGSFADAKKTAANTKKLLMIDAFAVWCGPCKAMEANTFTDQTVGDFYNTRFINFQLDMEKGEGIDFAWKYNVNAYPTIIYLLPEGEEVYRFVGSKDGPAFIREGEKALSKAGGSGSEKLPEADSIPAEWFSGPPDGTEILETINTKFEHLVLDLVNNERKKRNLSPLSWREDLGNSARYHAADMGSDDYFDHNTYDTTPSGEQILVCGTWERIKPFASNPAAENIAAGQTTPQAVMSNWMNSPGHKANILNKDLKYLGVGYYFIEDSTYGHYWVQNFGY